MVVANDSRGHFVGNTNIRDETLVIFAVLFNEFIVKNAFLRYSMIVDKDAIEIGAVEIDFSTSASSAEEG